MTLSPLGNLAAAPQSSPDGHWRFADLTGRLVELSGMASTTMAIGLIHDAQQKLEPTAWITCRDSVFFPPDARDAGVDLDALPVLFVADEQCAARAADQLLRSGAFGLLVLDLGPRMRVSMPLQTRLVGLARKHDATVLFVTEPGSARRRAATQSISSLISLRAFASRARSAGSDVDHDRYGYGVDAVKDKRHGPGWRHQELRRGPAGVC